MTLVSAPSETLRGCLEAIRDGNDCFEKVRGCVHCWTQREATAALAILDEVEKRLQGLVDARYLGHLSDPTPAGRMARLNASAAECLSLIRPEVFPPPPAKTPQEETA